MANIKQTLNGKWNVKLKHIYSGVTIPVVLKYDDVNPVSLEVGSTYVSAATEWRTEVGTAIDTSRITFEQTEEVSDETKTYILNDINWEVIPLQKTLVVTLSQTTFDNTGGTATLDITSNSDWTITINGDWIVIPTMSGDGDLSQTITIANYTGTTEREGVITITCGDIVRTFEITQNAVAPTISISSTTPIEATATSISYTVTSNMDAVTVKYGNQTKTTKTGSFTIPVNTSIHDVTHEITASCTDYPTVTATTSVVQNAAEYVFNVNPTTFNFASAGGEKEMTITNPNGYAWEIQDLPTWITANITAGTGNETIILKVGETFDARSGSFNVKDTTNNRTTSVTCSQVAGTFSVGTLDTFDNTGGTKQFEIINTVEHNWQIITVPSWLQVSPITGSTSTSVDVTATALTSNTRSDNIVVKDLNTNITYNVYAEQRGLQPDDTCTFVMKHSATNISTSVGNGCYGTITEGSGSYNNIKYTISDETSTSYCFYNLTGDFSAGSTPNVTITNNTDDKRFTVKYKDAFKFMIQFALPLVGGEASDWYCSSIFLSITFKNKNTGESKTITLSQYTPLSGWSYVRYVTEIFGDWFRANETIEIEPSFHLDIM